MNVLFILADQHNPAFSGCYGHPLARTPHTDSLARRGTRFESAYCASPLCVPARAALFSGRYVHETGIWDNTKAYGGVPGSWGHYFRDSGVCYATVGSVDFAPDVNCGIEQELMPARHTGMDVCGLFRDEVVPRVRLHMALREIKPRRLDEPATYDMQVRDRAVQWLCRERPADRPWVLTLNFLAPHPGWRPREDIWPRYQGTIRDLPPKYWQKSADLHPADQAFSIHSCGEAFSREDVLRCHEAYLAVIEELDEHVGVLLRTLEGEGILDDTLVIYGSDHGEMMRAHAGWTKCSMYEDSIRVPLIMAGPGVAAGRVDAAPVSHLDVYPTICEAVGLPPCWDKRGLSLLGDRRPRFVFSEFHANGSPNGRFAIRSGSWKLIETANRRPQLYDLHADPDEMHDLLAGPGAESPVACEKLAELRSMLSTICSPQAVDARAKQDQARLKAELEASGRLDKELAQRGFRRESGQLANIPSVS